MKELHLVVLVAIATLTDAAYNGRLVGRLRTLAHEVKGTVYVASDRHLILDGFTYDGAGPDAFFYVGTSGRPSSDGTIIPDENQSFGVLGQYNNERIVLTLPEDVGTTEDIVWFSVWCRRFTANFGDLMFPEMLEAPAAVDVGWFSTLAHKVASRTVTILDERRALIKDFVYDGQGPDAFFMAGETGGPKADRSLIIPDDTGNSVDPVRRIDNEDIMLTLPEGKSFMKIRWISLFCIAYDENFGQVNIPAGLNLPAYFAEKDEETMENCESLHKHLSVAWTVRGEYITIELTGGLEEDGYMAFGVSGSDTGSRMDGGDVAVCYHGDDGARCDDYTLQSKALCSGDSGVCPKSSLGETSDLRLLSSRERDGVLTVRYSRPLKAASPSGRDIPASGEVYVIWALGSRNSQGRVTRHDTRLQGDLRLSLRRQGARKCGRVLPPGGVAVQGWERQPLCPGDIQDGPINVQIGPAGGSKGYSAITGEQSWGIAWYVNGQLIPELYVLRGVTYEFVVSGGDDPARAASYHPFYITDDPVGGFADKTAAERRAVEVYAGVEGGNATAVGRYCEYQHGARTQAAEGYATFTDYFATLENKCEDGEPGHLLWTPDSDTPDTVYYQCFTHQYLGWKIHVIDDPSDCVIGASTMTHASLLTLVTMLVTALLLR